MTKDLLENLEDLKKKMKIALTCVTLKYLEFKGMPRKLNIICTLPENNKH